MRHNFREVFNTVGIFDGKLKNFQFKAPALGNLFR